MELFSPLNWKKSEIGFVAVVLVCLVGVSFLQLRLGQQKTRDAQRHADLELVGRALDAYLSDHKILPAATADGRIIACGDIGDKPCDWNSGPMMDQEGVAYINKLPIDPFTSKGWQYVYTVTPNRLNYKVTTLLEYGCKNLVQCNWYVKN